MPIYEYRCTRCGHQFEVTQGVGKTVDRCETCGGPVRKVFSSVGIIFKGSGFHVNDYRKTPAPADGEGKAADGASKTDASKTGDVSKTDAASKGSEPSKAGAASRGSEPSKAGTSKAGDRSSEKSGSTAASGKRARPESS